MAVTLEQGFLPKYHICSYNGQSRVAVRGLIRLSIRVTKRDTEGFYRTLIGNPKP